MPRSSSLVENLNSRRRNYFTPRRHLGSPYLNLLRFFLNHRRYMRSQLAERIGKSPRELVTGETHPHWSLAGPRTASESASLNRRRLVGLLPHNDKIRPSTAGCFRASVCHPKTADSEPRHKIY